MKTSEESVYHYIQVVFDKIYHQKVFECNDKRQTAETVVFWKYTLQKCLFLMRQAKMLKFSCNNTRGKVIFKNHKICFDYLTYHDVWLSDEKNECIANKKMYLDYALSRGYDFLGEQRMVEKKDFFATDDQTLLAIARKLERIEFVLITQKKIEQRRSYLQKVFA